MTERQKGHVSVDKAAYRKPQDVERALADDPIRRARAALERQGLAAQADAIEREARAEIDAALAAAEAAPFPACEAAYQEIANTGEGVWK